MTKFKSIILFLFFALFSVVAMAEDYVRDGRPCLSGICVGDDVSALAKIKWQTPTYIPTDAFVEKSIYSFKIDKAVENRILIHFSPSAVNVVRPAVRYLISGRFDTKAIPILAKVKGLCERISSIKGIFISESGYRTEVILDFVPESNPSDQSLRVVAIHRYFTNLSSLQLNELSKQMGERYQGVKNYAMPSYDEPTWFFNRDFIYLKGTAINFDERDTQLSQYPGCAKSVKID